MNTNTRTNEQIRVPQVRLIDAEGKQVGVVPIEDALRRAREAALDLVEVAAEAQPPVCRIFDYRKLVYDQKRRQKESRKKAHHIETKEIKVHVTIDSHDLAVKGRHARTFLEEGNKVKLTLQFRGREITKRDLAGRVIELFLKQVADIAEVEQGLTSQGRSQHLVLSRRAGVLPVKPAEPAEEPESAPAADARPLASRPAPPPAPSARIAPAAPRPAPAAPTAKAPVAAAEE